jgi:hypothetical protein
MKTALQIDRVYNKVYMPVNYIINDAIQTKQILKHFKSDPQLYARNQARKDSLTAVPKVYFDELDSHMPEDPNTKVVGKITFIHETPKRVAKPGILGKILLLILGIIAFNTIFIVLTHEQQKIENTCAIYYKHGKPEHMKFNGKEYNFSEFTEEDMLFMNPWTKQKAENTLISDCLQIYTE